MLSAKLSASSSSKDHNNNSSSLMKGSSSSRSGSLPPSRHSTGSTFSAGTPSPTNHNISTSFSSSGRNTAATSSSTSNYLSTGNLSRGELYSTSRMSYILLSSEHLHRGPTSISTTDPYLAEKCPFTVIKDTVYFQAEPKYDPHGRCWSMRVEDAPVRVLNKLFDLGYKAVAESSVMGAFKQPGHAWTLFRDRL